MGKMILRTNKQAVELAMVKVHNFTEENLIVIYLDPNARVIATELIEIGISNNVLITPREIYRQALDFDASCIMLLHNHPGGVLQPSPNDIKTMRIIERAGEMLMLPLVDSLIFTKEGKMYSFREHRLLKAIPSVKHDILPIDK
jgi:DNA repair protein RadC